MAPDVHPDIAALARLLGTWQGEGEGFYPTIEPFSYREEMVFEHVGDPFLLYRQASWLLGDGAPLHLERGFLRPGRETGSWELTLAHPLGLTEISQGRMEGGSLELVSRAVGRTESGSAVTGVRRRYRIEEDTIAYELDMAMDATPMTQHLVGEVRRIVP